MTFKHLRHALAFTVCFLILASTVSVADDQSLLKFTSTKSTTNQADVRMLIRSGRFEEALNSLRLQAQGLKIDADVLFLIGLAAIGASQRSELMENQREALLNEAIGAFRAMLIARPELVRVRLELARAFFLKGEDDLSRKHFEYVLAAELPAAVVANVRRFLLEIRARRRWDLRMGFALTPDSNISSTSAARNIYINGLPFIRHEEELISSGIGSLIWMGGEYHYPLNERLRLRAGADISRREYEGSQFDQTYLAGYTGPRWFLGKHSEVSVLASMQRSWGAGVSDYDAFGVRVETEYRFDQQLKINVHSSWHDRRYRTATILDGPTVDFSISGIRVMTPTIAMNAAMGWGRDRPKEKKWNHHRRWLQLGIEVALRRGFNWGGSVQFRWTDYEGNWFPNTPAHVSREDFTRTFRTSVHHRAFTWNGFSPQVSLIHEERTTNAQLYEYKRNSIELGFVRLF